MYEYFETASAIRKTVNDKKAEYIKKFGLPNYIKIPSHLYRKMKAASMIYEESCQIFHPEMLMGLIVCPTESIEEIDEIEVF